LHGLVLIKILFTWLHVFILFVWFSLVLVDGANLGRSVIKVNIFFQLIAFSFIPSGFHGAVFPCKNVKNQLELQF